MRNAKNQGRSLRNCDENAGNKVKNMRKFE